MASPIIFGWKWLVTTGYRDYMRQPEVQELLEDAGGRIVAAAGGTDAGYEVDVEPRSGRRDVPRVSVRTTTAASRRDEAVNRTLSRSLDAGSDV